MRTYLLEAYVPRSSARRLTDLDADAREAAATLGRRGRPVRLVRSIYLPCDETCFLLVETKERRAAEELGGRLELAVVRLAEAFTVPQTSSRTIGPMAYDEELAERIRELVSGEPGLTEREMFGGLAFLIGGNMAIAASGQGGLLVRADPDESDALVATTNARLMEMRGRKMRGWLRVEAEDVRTKRELARWANLGTAYARSLPAKHGK